MVTTTDSLRDLLRPGAATTNVEAWRWSVRRRLVPVRDELVAEPPLDRRDAWSSAGLSARAACVVRRRDALLSRLQRLSQEVMVTHDVDRVAGRLSRLLVDIEHHRQRLRDLAYDDVELELGGSE